ncbi:MAG TPA: ATP-dependent DNA ligase [Candidatus Binatia bacterium]|nr:ATP-dependent DNA ligase [Candidatus Binatia bacterium]
MTPFRDLAALCEALARTRSRRALAGRLAEFLAALDPDEVRPAVRLLLGTAGKGEAAVSGATVARVLARMAGRPQMPPEAWAGAVDFGEAAERLLAESGSGAGEPPALAIAEVEARIRALAGARGAGSRAAKERLLADLLAALTPVEAKYVVKNLIREMRTGVADGIVLDALARAAGTRRDAIARMHLLEGDLAEVAARVLAHRGGPPPESALEYFRPLRPMLAQTAESVTEALALFEGRAAVEEKLDGARVQIHKRGSTCRLYSRRLQELTGSLPDVVAHVHADLAVPAAILEGEVVAVDAAGRMLPFQELMRRFRRRRDVERLVAEVPVRLQLFDVLQVEDAPLIDEPYGARWATLERVRGGCAGVGRVAPEDATAGEAFYARALADGLEGVMVKGLDAPYAPGIRGRGWLKVKRATTLDLVVVAADRGYGRRHGWLSNYHLAARDEETGRLEPVGKTFKGLTDAELRAMTERLSALAVGERGPTVFVEPRVVVEVRFSDLQRSPTYPAGLALRFARIVRVRDDKTPAEADTIQHLRTLLARQQAGGRPGGAELASPGPRR